MQDRVCAIEVSGERQTGQSPVYLEGRDAGSRDYAGRRKASCRAAFERRRRGEELKCIQRGADGRDLSLDRRRAEDVHRDGGGERVPPEVARRQQETVLLIIAPYHVLYYNYQYRHALYLFFHLL